jgi:hypothetical protein
MSVTATSISPYALDITTTCQIIVEDCLSGKIELTTVPDNLKAIRITPEPPQDYIKQITQQIGEKRRGIRSDVLDSGLEVPEGLRDNDQNEF